MDYRQRATLVLGDYGKVLRLGINAEQQDVARPSHIYWPQVLDEHPPQRVTLWVARVASRCPLDIVKCLGRHDAEAASHHD